MRLGISAVISVQPVGREMVARLDIDLAARQEYTYILVIWQKASIPLYWN